MGKRGAVHEALLLPWRPNSKHLIHARGYNALGESREHAKSEKEGDIVDHEGYGSGQKGS